MSRTLHTHKLYAKRTYGDLQVNQAQKKPLKPEYKAVLTPKFCELKIQKIFVTTTKFIIGQHLTFSLTNYYH